MPSHNRNTTPHVSTPGFTGIVTQAMLAEFQVARQRATVASRRLAKIEKKLIELIDAETPVERGSLGAHVQGFLSYDLDVRDLRHYLSEMDYGAFVTSLPLQSRKELVVEDQDADIEVELSDSPVERPHRSAVASKNRRSRKE